MKNYDTYTGIISYKKIDFTFIFDKKILKLIPPKEKQREVGMWFMKEIEKGVYTFGDPIYVEEIIYGIANETGQRIVLIPAHKSIGRINSTLLIDIEFYIINKYNREKIDRIAIKGPEITHIFPTTSALNKINWGDNGVIDVITKPFSETTTEKEKFSIDEKELLLYFGISISSSYKTGESPISLSSTMFIEFDATDDYEFIITLLRVSKQFIQYLCYRRNVVFSSVEIASPTANGLHETFATLYETQENDVIETYPIEKERFIKYGYIKGIIGKIIDDIVTKTIYLEHIPETYELGRHINAGRFVMITAAFEWEFKRNYPLGIAKSKKTIEAEKRVTDIIDDLIKNNTGKSKEIFKFLKKLIKSDNLESRIIEYGNDYGNISDIFGNHLYNLNNEKLDYKQMGKRLSDQRNHFAHGDIDKEFIGLSLLDLIYLEYIVYIMQLKFYGLDDDMIKCAINDLFRCNLAL
ncbi:MAG: hypothetical protein NC181_02320 [Clostridium sp.]|nr:hypothetical protein [Clostridium sp.]MCM1443719.1 hypothetical protein [Candidatus Amulumruptor caecigallinarius]